MSKSHKKLFIFGFGFLSRAVATRLADDFHHIVGTTRSSEKAQKMYGEGIDAVLFDAGSNNDNLLHELGQASHVLISIAPDEDGDPVLNTLSKQIAQSDKLEWLGYLSTVGVYGDYNGAWVNEETLPKPVSKRSLQRVAAENAWQAFASRNNIPLAIFRLSGIYGPGRNAFMNIEKGTARRLVKPGQVFNRIHREDIAEAVAKAIEHKASGIFNITDDEPAPPQDVVTYAHELAGVVPPPEIDIETADLSPMARSFYGENKRVSNAKSKEVLKMTYRWPNYREGLKRMWVDNMWRA